MPTDVVRAAVERAAYVLDHEGAPEHALVELLLRESVAGADGSCFAGVVGLREAPVAVLLAFDGKAVDEMAGTVFPGDLHLRVLIRHLSAPAVSDDDVEDRVLHGE